MKELEKTGNFIPSVILWNKAVVRCGGNRQGREISSMMKFPYVLLFQIPQRFQILQGFLIKHGFLEELSMDIEVLQIGMG